MKKSSLYTKSGDKGETSLVSGARVSKADSQIDLYGEVDSLNSCIGYLYSLLEDEPVNNIALSKLILEVQNALFDLGSLLACEPENWSKFKLKTLSVDLIGSLEAQIDELDSKTSELKNFILPGGTKAAAYTHVCRTQTRKVERLLIAYKASGIVPENSIELLNRLSDFFFIVSRYINVVQNKPEILWKQN